MYVEKHLNDEYTCDLEILQLIHFQKLLTLEYTKTKCKLFICKSFILHFKRILSHSLNIFVEIFSFSFCLIFLFNYFHVCQNKFDLLSEVL